MKKIPALLLLISIAPALRAQGILSSLSRLPVYPATTAQAPKGDWLLGDTGYVAGVFRSPDGKDLVMANGLISRTFRVSPYMACYSLRNLATGEEMLRALRPEAAIEVNGRT
jgi:hypothetical protein